mmetsp:Transcript_51126/g.128345  ORF Transcript_51126/g.128345 Transcript_51126/m.128345 type:complete len:237 (-) Transcript_51126:51-761(-)
MDWGCCMAVLVSFLPAGRSGSLNLGSASVYGETMMGYISMWCWLMIRSLASVGRHWRPSARLVAALRASPACRSPPLSDVRLKYRMFALLLCPQKPCLFLASSLTPVRELEPNRQPLRMLLSCGRMPPGSSLSKRPLSSPAISCSFSASICSSSSRITRSSSATLLSGLRPSDSLFIGSSAGASLPVMASFVSSDPEPLMVVEMSPFCNACVEASEVMVGAAASTIAAFFAGGKDE